LCSYILFTIVYKGATLTLRSTAFTEELVAMLGTEVTGLTQFVHLYIDMDIYVYLFIYLFIYLCVCIRFASVCACATMTLQSPAFTEELIAMLGTEVPLIYTIFYTYIYIYIYRWIHRYIDT